MRKVITIRIFCLISVVRETIVSTVGGECVVVGAELDVAFVASALEPTHCKGYFACAAAKVTVSMEIRSSREAQHLADHCSSVDVPRSAPQPHNPPRSTPSVHVTEGAAMKIDISRALGGPVSSQ